MKVLIVEKHAAPYRDDTFREFMNKTKAEVLIFSEIKGDQHNHSEWNYTSCMQDFRKFAKGRIAWKVDYYRKGYLKCLLDFKPDVVVTPSVIEGKLAKIFLKARVVCTADTVKKGRYAKQKWNQVLRTWMYRQCDAWWIPGYAGEEYFREFLGSDHPIYHGSYTNDAVTLNQKMQEYRAEKDMYRKEIGVLPDEFLFLFVGKMIPTRHIEVLLNAMKQLPNEMKIKFLCIGNGPDFEKAKEYSKQDSRLILIPSVPLKELEKYYAIADAYLHPGEEPYSLALYEAAIAGIPMLSSNKVGAVYDCLENGKNGYIFAFCNAEDLREKIQMMYNGKLDPKDVKAKQTFILTQRGTDWAAKELAKACGISLK